MNQVVSTAVNDALARLPRASWRNNLPGLPTLLRWYQWRMALEQIVVFDDDRQKIWRAELPRSELLAHFDPRARYVRPDYVPEIVGILTMGGLGWFLGFTLWYMWIPAPIFDLIMGAGPAFLIGVTGWWIGPLFGPKAHWMARRRGGQLTPMLHGAVPLEPGRPADPDATPERVREVRQAYDRVAMEGVEVLTSEVMFEVMEMRDEKALVTGGLSRWQKIALTGVFTLLGAMVVALFFFGAVFTQQGG